MHSLRLTRRHDGNRFHVHPIVLSINSKAALRDLRPPGLEFDQRGAVMPQRDRYVFASITRFTFPPVWLTGNLGERLLAVSIRDLQSVALALETPDRPRSITLRRPCTGQFPGIVFSGRHSHHHHRDTQLYRKHLRPLRVEFAPGAPARIYLNQLPAACLSR